MGMEISLGSSVVFAKMTLFREAFTCDYSILYHMIASDIIHTLKNGIARRTSCVYPVFRADFGLETESSAL